MKKILSMVLLGIVLFSAVLSITGCNAAPANTKLFTPRSNVTITVEQTMTLYKDADSNSAMIGYAPPGEYKVLEAIKSKDDQGTWVLVSVKGEKGYLLGFWTKVSTGK
jgi:hypothetical protein